MSQLKKRSEQKHRELAKLELNQCLLEEIESEQKTHRSEEEMEAGEDEATTKSDLN